jgi:mannose-6-phosphate isomerase
MGIEKLGPFRLAPWFSPRPWGRRDLRPWYAATGTTEPVGEAWLTGPESVVETGPMTGRTLSAVAAEAGEALLGAGRIDKSKSAAFPLLVKLLFPNDRLSVQVRRRWDSLGARQSAGTCWRRSRARRLRWG